MRKSPKHSRLLTAELRATHSASFPSNSSKKYQFTTLRTYGKTGFPSLESDLEARIRLSARLRLASSASLRKPACMT